MFALKNIWKGKPDLSERDQEISQTVPISSCDSECGSCTTKFPPSVKVDDGDIYKSAQPTGLHFIVPTSKADWAHDATGTSNTIENKISQWIGKHGADFVKEGSVKVSASSLPFDSMDPRCYKGEVNDVLILPYFVWIKKVDLDNVFPLLNELIPILIKSRDDKISPPTEIQRFKIEIAVEQAYVFLCSHRTRDKRCGITAPLMKKEMDHRLRELELYRDIGDDRPNGVKVCYVNHVGGHKFVANVQVYMKTGEIIWLAKCNPANAIPIIDETVLGGGKVWSKFVRVVQKTKGIEW
ncbi:Actin patches distal protein 1 [Wickerhamomyces ciferrii]|uniref:Actin patches distal protein 1 n=1 Tax=Wickerhamomyces ciferrii (strain ATCC 14091 / BCRC 22168 / CBS 111 / JCM 3599 / NBRC 0793 / NRRL Y-1031 F-60-10) TaxID=1206466 RepID=K0KUK6_WICCF|nr:Actin patches distal protein 1 [Wickerhamomyces ciferrii]CCH45114.1 Actin patches distal protein 1 [Wickerhamomyces ciferrii]